MKKVRVHCADPSGNLYANDIDADTIGGADGELILFKNEQVVAIYAAGCWANAIALPDPGSLPS